MKTINLLEKLKNKPVFRIRDIERIADCNREYAKVILNRLKKRELVKNIKRNAYTTKDNIFVIAGNIIYPSYISFWSASYFLGYTEQMLNTIHVATTRKVNSINFEGYKIKFVPIKEFFGYKKIRTEDGDIFIAENEKLIIDAFLRYKELGNFDEIKKIFENADIDKTKIIEYLKKTNKQSIIKRVGYLLEHIKKMDLSKSFKPDKNYVLLNPFSKTWKKTNAKWRIRI